MQPRRLFLGFIGILLALFLVSCTHKQPEHILPATVEPTVIPSNPTGIATNSTSSISILVDDFSPQPYQGESVYFFNRLEGDRGAINDSIMDWGNGQVTTTISSGNSWGGGWMSLNHPIREGLPINFSAILPAQILPAYQSQITGIKVLIARGTPGRIFRLELKYGSELLWKKAITLKSGGQVVNFDLPALGNVNQLVWVLDQASPGDTVVLDNVSFTAATRVTDTATDAFVWSYGMLLNNWNPSTGLVRDKAKDASGEFDAIQATGCLAAATAVAEQLGFVSNADAVQIVNKISDALLISLPRFHGLWPHWVKASPAGKISIVEKTEWSSVDTVIAAIGLLEAQSGLGMDPSGTGQMLQAIEWKDLVTSAGISHGYTYTGDLIPYAWDVFGGESWLVELAYAGATGKVTPLAYPTPPTANGSGFIDELAWLFAPPPSGQDYWGTDWSKYRVTAADNQVNYASTNYPASCLTQYDLFGLSAAEVPYPSMVPQNSIYQAFGMGGQFASANDGAALLHAPVVVPHYSAMVASLRPREAIQMWGWLIKNGYFTPLNNVESLVFPANSNCDPDSMVWNQLKGSWNLSLQTLGWGRYLAEQAGQIPILWQATTANPILHKGYLLLTSGVPSQALTSIPDLTPQADALSGGTDGWSSSGLAGSSINALAIDPATPATLYAVTGDGMFKSTDGGGNWSTVDTGLSYPVYSWAIDPVKPNTLYAGTDNGVFKSTDGGGSWHAANSGLGDPPNDGQTGFRVSALAIDPLNPTTLYAETSHYTYPGSSRYINSRVLKSMDGGGSWSEINDNNADFVVLAVDPVKPDTLYAGVFGSGLFTSTDGGGSWSQGSFDPFIFALAIDPIASNTLYEGTDGGVFKSVDGGGNWSEINTGLTKTNIRALVIDPSTPNILYAGTDNGVFRRTINAAPPTWAVSRECENPDASTVGQRIWRSNASGSGVHGQFGTGPTSPWLAKSGYVKYNLYTPQIDALYLKLHYSKYSPPSVPILIYIDDEPTPRATLYPIDQESWDQFIWTDPILLGGVKGGMHSIKFSTEGQQYGVADLDLFILTAGSP